MDKISEKIKAARIAKGGTIYNRRKSLRSNIYLSVNVIKDIDGAFERFDWRRAICKNVS